MIISYNWLNSYFDNTLPDVKEVERLLVKHSFEIEGIDKTADDWAIDVDVLANRSHDALSHFGIARDIAVILDKEAKLPIPRLTLETGLETKEHLEVRVETDLAKRVTKRLVTDVRVGESPDWLKKRLATRGQKAINNIVDITNYAMFETGQPIHAFDYDKLNSNGDKKVVTLRMSKVGEPLTLLDGLELDLGDGSLVWADREGALDLAGIKGGMDSGVDKNTTRIVLSACHFDPVYIRKTRKRHKVITDASRNFEHELSPELAMLGNERAAEMIADIAGGKLAEVIDIYPVSQEPAEARFQTEYFNSIIGLNLSDSDIESVLDRMRHAGFSWSKVGDDYIVKVPPERLDVRELHEIIEEVARFYGYDNVKSELAGQYGFAPRVHKSFYYNSLIKKVMVEELGYSELYNYIMSGEGELEFENSMVEGMSHLRSNMLGTMTANLEQNLKNVDVLGLDQIRLFELNKVAYLAGEHWALGFGVKNTKSWKGTSEREEIDRTIESLDAKLDSKGDWKIDETEVGVIAEVNIEKWTESLPTPESYGDVLSASSRGMVFKPYSAYPVVLRDIAVWTPEGTTADDVLGLIREQARLHQGTGEGEEWLVQSRLFDEFTKDGRTSYAYRLVFQSMGRTLNDKEVTELMTKLEAKLNGMDGYKVR